MANVFAGSRKDLAVALLVAVGGAGALAACSSDSATYKPAPRYTNTGPSTTQYQPSTTYASPAPAPAPKGGQASCGKGGKCG